MDSYNKISYNNISLRNFQVLSFKAKIPKGATKKISEETLKTASAATAAVGIAGIMLSAGKGQEEKEFDLDRMLKESIKSHLGREVYIVTRNEFVDKPEYLERYMNRHTEILLKDYDKIDDETINHIRSLMKELVLERISNKSLPENFSDIDFLDAKDKTVKYADLVLTKENLETMVDKGLSFQKISELTGCQFKQVLCRAKKYEIKSQRQEGLEKVNALLQRKDEIKKCIDAGYSLAQLQEVFQVASPATMMRLLAALGLQTEGQKALESTLNISDEKIIELYKQGKTTKQMGKILNCSSSTISQRLKKLGLQTERQKDIGKYDNVLTKENLKKYVDKGMILREMADIFGCAPATIKRKLKEFGLKTEMQIRNEEIAQINNEEIIEYVKNGMGLYEIAQKFGVSSTVVKNRLKALNLKTRFQEIRDYNNNINDAELIKLAEEGFSVREIAEKLGCATPSPVRLKLLQLKKDTVYAEKLKRTEEKKDEAQKLFLEGKDKKDIAKILNVSLSTVKNYLRAGKEFGFDYKNCSKEDLCDKLLEQILEDENIANSKELEEIGDFIFNNIGKISDVSLLFDLVKGLGQVRAKKMTLQEFLEKDTVNKIYELQERLDAQAFENWLKVERFNNAYLQISTISNPRIIEMFAIYQPEANGKNLAEAEAITDIVNDCQGDLKKVERRLVYWDAKRNDDEHVKNAERYSLDNQGNVDEEKAGQYINNARVLENYIKNGETSHYPQEVFDILGDSHLPQKLLISYLMRIEDWMNEKNKNLLNDFLKIFKPEEGEIESKIVKSYIVDYYLNQDTEIPLVYENGRKHTAVFSNKAKKAIYQRYKFPKCVDFLAKFEEIMSKPAVKKGDSGVKYCSQCKPAFYEVKIMGYPDRLFCSNLNDLYFDEHSYQHRR